MMKLCELLQGNASATDRQWFQDDDQSWEFHTKKSSNLAPIRAQLRIVNSKARTISFHTDDDTVRV